MFEYFSKDSSSAQKKKKTHIKKTMQFGPIELQT